MRKNILLVSLLITVLGIGIYLATRTVKQAANLPQLVDSQNKFQINFPEGSVNLRTGQLITDSIEIQNSLFQFTPQVFAQLGSEVAPFFQVSVVDPQTWSNTGTLTVEDYLTYIRPTYDNAEPTTNGRWRQLCSSETPAKHCVAVTQLPNAKLVVLSYETQATETAAGSFFTLFKTILDQTTIQ